jgi:ubiquitin-activating enzyme E1
MWARDVFVGLFDQAPRAASMVLEGPDYIGRNRVADAKALAEKLKSVKEMLITERCDTFEDCVKWARRKFDEFFNWRIRDLRTKFPEDQRTPLGMPFWLPPRRFPRIVEYDPENEWHARFINATAILRARTCGIVAKGDAAQLAATFQFDYVPDTLSIPDDPNAEPDDPAGPVADLDRLITELKDVLVTDRKFVPEQFEKDNDANSHIDFVAAAANIRATNYLLEPEDKFSIKKIAGQIIPAIATTTAMVCGFVSLEMYKVHAPEKKPITAFRAGAANLAASMFTMMVPRKAATTVCPLNGQKFTVWDYWRIDGDLTLQELIQQLNEKYQVEPEQIISQGAFLKSWASDEATLAARMQRRISDTLVTEMGKKPLAPGQNTIEIIVLQSDAEGNDLPIPKVLLKVR